MSEIMLTGPLPPVSVPAQDSARLVAAIGTARFFEQALALGATAAGAAFFSAFCQGDRDHPLLVGTASTLGARRAEQAAESYARHAGSDRNTALLNGDRGPGDFLTFQAAADVTPFPYRRDCYDRPGIGGRLSLIRRTPSYGLSVSLYSRAEDGPLPTERHPEVAAVLSLILAATERHVAFSLAGTVWQGQDIQARLALCHPDLTFREREVAAMTIKGRTAAEIGQILGLAETTVITHRKKAYKRMNVSNLRQLLAAHPGRRPFDEGASL